MSGPATGGPAPEAVAVLLKRVDLRAEVDPLTATVTPDPHGGLSAADECALELGLRTAAAEERRLVAVSAGPEAADAVLRTALEAGADRAVRVELPAATSSALVASALADVVRGRPLGLLRRLQPRPGQRIGPAFVAGRLGAAQALGVAAITLPGAPDGGLRGAPLGRGRRELLEVEAPAVVSVESGLAGLRRPPLSAMLAARAAAIEVVIAPPAS